MPSILTVGRNRRNLELLADLLAREGFDTCQALSLDDLDRELSCKGKVSVALVDLAGFGARIWQRCEKLREDGIPFIILSPRQSKALESESRSRGASGILVKPLVAEQLLGIVRTMAGDPNGGSTRRTPGVGPDIAEPGVRKPTSEAPQSRSDPMALSNIGSTIRDTLSGTIKGAGSILEATVDTTKNATVTTLRGAGDVLKEVTTVTTDAVGGALEAVNAVGGKAGNAVKGAVVGVITGVGEVTTVTAGVLSDTIRAAIKGTSDVGTDVGTVATKAAEGAITATRDIGISASDAAFGIARGAIQGTKDVGGDLALTAKNTVRGTIQGTNEIGGDALQVIRDTARGLVKGTADVGGDVAKVARGAVEGAIETAKDVGIKASDAASAAATGAVDAAGDIGESTARNVTNVLDTSISGVKVVVGAPFRKEGKQGGETPPAGGGAL